MSPVAFPGLEEWRQRLEALLKGPPLLGLKGIRSLRERGSLPTLGHCTSAGFAGPGVDEVRRARGSFQM